MEIRKGIKTNKELSLGRKIDEGWTDKQLMDYYSLDEKHLKRIKESLTAIRAAPKAKVKAKAEQK